MNDAGIVAAIRPTLRELTGATRDLDPLLELAGDAHFVLIGDTREVPETYPSTL